MTNYNLDNFDPIPAPVISAEDAAEYERAKAEAEQKIHRINQFILANNNRDEEEKNEL